MILTYLLRNLNDDAVWKGLTSESIALLCRIAALHILINDSAILFPMTLLSLIWNLLADLLVCALQLGMLDGLTYTLLFAFLNRLLDPTRLSSGNKLTCH